MTKFQIMQRVEATDAILALLIDDMRADYRRFASPATRAAIERYGKSVRLAHDTLPLARPSKPPIRKVDIAVAKIAKTEAERAVG